MGFEVIIFKGFLRHMNGITGLQLLRSTSQDKTHRLQEGSIAFTASSLVGGAQVMSGGRNEVLQEHMHSNLKLGSLLSEHEISI